MKYSKLLCLTASFLLLASCGKGSGSEKDPVKLLTDALDSVGTNYTVEWWVDGEGEDEYHPAAKYGEGFMEHIYTEQVTGFGKVANDKNTYHAFDHYKPGNVTEWNGEYFNLSGRRDYSDAKLLKEATLKNYFDLTKFEKVENGRYRSKDEMNIVKYLDAINTAFGYYALGSGHEGIDIVLNKDGSFKTIEWYGVGDEDTGEQVSADRWAYCVFSDIGTSVDTIFSEYVADEANIPDPSFDDLGIISADTKKNLYEGETVNLEDMIMTGPYGNYYSLINNENSYAGFIIKNPDSYLDNVNSLVNVEGVIGTENGHTVLEVTSMDVTEEGYANENEIPYCEAYDGEGFFYDFGDWEYGVRNSGSLIDIYNAVYAGYEVDGNNLVVNVSYVSCGKTYDIPVVVSTDAEALEANKADWEEFVSGLDVVEGETPLSIYNVLFVYEGDEYKTYASEDTVVECGPSFRETVLNSFGVRLPSYDGFLGFEYFFETDIPADDEHHYRGLLGIADIKEDRAANFVSEYAALLVEEGFTFNSSYEAYEDGPTVYLYIQNGIAVAFTAPINEEDYYYTQFQIADTTELIDNPIWEDEE